MDKTLKICHLYPEVLNLYGDRGNILCMKKRLEWRNINAEICELKLGQKADLTEFDLFFIGGGQDFEQEVLLNDLKSGKGDEIKAAVNDGKTFLCICGGYQMMGHYYETHEGVKCEFLGAVDFHTIGTETRMIGNYAYELLEESGGSTVIGYENHSGRTYLASGINPLGKVVRGYGNNGEDSTEGVRFNNVFGTYSHGPVLPKNPKLCDYILETALERRYGEKIILDNLSDKMETQAHDSVHKKIMSGDIK